MCDSIHMKCLGIGKFIEIGSRLVIGAERRAWGVTAKRYRVSFCGDANVLELDTGGGCTTL